MFWSLRCGWECELAMNPTEFRVGSLLGNTPDAMDWFLQQRVLVEELKRVFSPLETASVFGQFLQREGNFLAAIFDWRRLARSTIKRRSQHAN
jgi:hypothetical protein